MRTAILIPPSMDSVAEEAVALAVVPPGRKILIITLTLFRIPAVSGQTRAAEMMEEDNPAAALVAPRVVEVAAAAEPDFEGPAIQNFVPRHLVPACTARAA